MEKRWEKQSTVHLAYKKNYLLQYWQFWRNTSDNDVSKFLGLFTDISSEKIGEIKSFRGLLN